MRPFDLECLCRQLPIAPKDLCRGLGWKRSWLGVKGFGSPAMRQVREPRVRVFIVREKKARLSSRQAGLSLLDKKHARAQSTVGQESSVLAERTSMHSLWPPC